MGESLSLSEATEHQRTSIWTLNGVSWAPPSSLESYIARERSLSQTPYASSSSPLGGTRYLYLHPEADPEDIICSLESTAKQVLIADRDGVRTEKGFAIASVYTNPAHRGKGMATQLLEKTKELIDSQSICSALYSDIGTQFYARQGWKVYPSLQVSITLEGAIGGQGDYRFPDSARFVKEEEVKGLCEKDVAGITQYFSGLGSDGQTHMTFLPTWEQVQWHFTRDAYMAKDLYGREIVNRGAITSDGKAWISWDHDFREKKLKIIRIVTHGSEKKSEDVKILLLAALAEAAGWDDLTKVLVWNPDEDVSRAAKVVGDLEKVQVIFDERLDGSIPSFRWKGDSDVATVWEFNDYASWC